MPDGLAQIVTSIARGLIEGRLVAAPTHASTVVSQNLLVSIYGTPRPQVKIEYLDFPQRPRIYDRRYGADSRL